MNCEQCNLHQEDFLAGELSSTEKQEFSEHVASCSACKESLENTIRIWQLVHGSCISACDGELKDKALEKIQQERQGSGDSKIHQQNPDLRDYLLESSRLRKHKILLQIAALLVIMLSSGILFSPTLFQSKSVTVALDTEGLADTAVPVVASRGAMEKEQTEKIRREEPPVDPESLAEQKKTDAAVSELKDDVGNLAVADTETLQKSHAVKGYNNLKKQNIIETKKKSSPLLDSASDTEDSLPFASSPSGALPQNSVVAEESREKTLGHAVNAAGGPLQKKSDYPGNHKKYFQQVVQLPDSKGTLLVYTEVFTRSSDSIPENIPLSIKVESVQPALKTVEHSDQNGLMLFYPGVGGQDRILCRIFLTKGEKRSAGIPLSAAMAVPFE